MCSAVQTTTKHNQFCRHTIAPLNALCTASLMIVYSALIVKIQMTSHAQDIIDFSIEKNKYAQASISVTKQQKSVSFTY